MPDDYIRLQRRDIPDALYGIGKYASGTYGIFGGIYPVVDVIFRTNSSTKNS